MSNSNLETTTTSSPKGNAKEDSPPVPGLDVLANAVDGELHNVTTKPGPNDVLLGRGGGMYEPWEMGVSIPVEVSLIIAIDNLQDQTITTATSSFEISSTLTKCATCWQ